MGWTLVCVLFLIFSIQRCSCQPSAPLHAAPSSVAVNRENGEVFIAAGSQLLRLSNTLVLLENVTVSGEGELVRLSLSPDGSRLVGCLGENSRTCLVYSSDNLTSGPSATVDNADYRTENGLAVIAADDDFYLGSEGAVIGQNNAIFLSQYNYTSDTVRVSRDGDPIYGVTGSTSGTFVRHFYGGIARNGYVYHFVADQTPNAVRVLRVCNCTRAPEPCTGVFEALYELPLQCPGSTTPTTRVCGVNFLESFADRDEPLVVVTQCDSGGTRNRACAFLMSDIDGDMDAYYEVCATTNTGSFTLPWEVSRQCSQFNPTSPCDFEQSPAINVESGGSGYYLVNLGNSVITASLAINVEDVSLLYVANSGVIEVYELTSTQIANPSTSQPVGTINDVVSVRDISWYEGSDYITVTTDSNIFLHPLEMCSDLTTCEECTGDESFPLCGWCTVENKCSRRSQCQNSTEERRWVNSTDPDSTNQCITTSVSPDQFILERPTVLNVTASPALPAGLTYNCSFSGTGDMFPLVVEAVEVTAGSLYQCDITAAITDLGTVKQVTDFSFVSIEVGVSFATRENALTIYDCDAATSCGECVDTDNACGWCLYGGLCSGTSAPCPTPAGVDNSYLMLGSSSGFAEVCPVLNAASTPSGHYTQPVMVARNLTLQAANLPLPVDGFRYECSLGGQTLQTSLNMSEETVSCHISDGLIDSMLAQKVVSLQLIWTNDSVRYPLNENSTDDIMCILYNCGGLASGCSACLGSNVAGFECGWCSGTTCAVMEECSAGTFSTSTDVCASPVITSVEPGRGPREGGTRVTITGTDLGAAFTDIVGVRLQSGGSVTNCPLTGESDYIPGLQIVCETGAVPSAGNYSLEVEISRDSQPSQNGSIPFQIEQPVVGAVDPSFGPKSGGVEVVISGSALDTGNTEETTVQLNGVNCDITQISSSQIRCVSAAFDNVGGPNVTVGDVQVFIDNAVVSGTEFEFRDDPVYTLVSPQSVIPAGGINLTFSGMNLDVVQRPMFIYVYDNSQVSTGGLCTVMNTEMTCVVPPFTNGLPSNINYTIQVGAAPGPDLSREELMLTVKANPVFAEDGSALVDNEITAGEDALLSITGVDLMNVKRGEIRVTVGGEVCTDRGSVGDDANTYVCTPPDQPPGGVREAEVVVSIGSILEYTVGTVSYSDPKSTSSSQLAIIIGACAAGGVLIVSVLVICCVICCFTRRAKEKDKQFTTLLAQMELWEVEMADECKRAFTELQTDLADLVQISDDKNLPYRDFRSFAMRFLFPSAGEDHPVLNPLAITDSEEVMPHLENFRQLILDKKFLLLFVRTLEAQQGRFSLQDKCNVASLLMVAFQNDLDYATDILKTLLSEVMHQAVSKSHPKLLLRRTESVAEKMLANWLCFLLFPYLLEHAGEPLFILYRAIKSQLEKGPVDVITGEARHSLSEEKLLRQKFDAKPIDSVVETETGELVAVKLLDCDTVSQAKEKILDILYKNTAVTARPGLTDVDLELRRSNAGIPLRDHDQTNVKEGDWTRINTLGHYRLAEMSQAAIDNPKNPTPRFKLVPRPERPVSGLSFDHLGTIISNLNSSSTLPFMAGHVFHLVKPDQGEGDEGVGPRQGKILSEVFLTRLLSTKRILQSYVDDLFKAIFAVPRGRPLPKAIKCLFDFLDLQAADLGIQDPEILHTWKTNSLPLRFWVNLIKNPDFVFDIHKSATVDACLTIIAQAYIDACSTSDIKYTKNTPSAKLLYVNEVRSYKQDVQQYYGTVQSLPKLSDHEMSEYLRETAQVCSQSVDSTELDKKHVFMTRQLYFVTESALYELFKYAAAYSDELQDALNEEGLSVMATKLEQLHGAIKV